jgi:hypothetical protein
VDGGVALGPAGVTSRNRLPSARTSPTNAPRGAPDSVLCQSNQASWISAAAMRIHQTVVDAGERTADDEDDRDWRLISVPSGCV